MEAQGAAWPADGSIPFSFTILSCPFHDRAARACSSKRLTRAMGSGKAPSPKGEMAVAVVSDPRARPQAVKRTMTVMAVNTRFQEAPSTRCRGR